MCTRILRKIWRSFQDSLTSGLFHSGKICTKKMFPPPRMFPGVNIHIHPKNSQQPKSLEQLARMTFHQLNFLDHWGPQYKRGKHMGIPGTQMRPLVLNGVLGGLTFQNRGHWGLGISCSLEPGFSQHFEASEFQSVPSSWIIQFIGCGV